MTQERIRWHEELFKQKLIRVPADGDSPMKKRHDALKEQAHEAFEDHEIRTGCLDSDRWTIAKKAKDGKWTSTYMAEIIPCSVGLIVCGDIDPVIFEGGDCRNSALSEVNWAATSHVDGYLDGKALMGFRSSTRNPAEEYDTEIAIAQIQNRICDIYETTCDDAVDENNYDHDETQRASFSYKTLQIECPDKKAVDRILEMVDVRLGCDHEIMAWTDAIECLRRGDAIELVKNELYDDLNRADVSDAGEMVYDLGIVTAVRVYYAHAACVRLNDLLCAMAKHEAE